MWKDDLFARGELQQAAACADGTGFFIILCLCMPELAVFAAGICHQRFMSSLLYELSVVKHGNGIAETAA